MSSSTSPCTPGRSSCWRKRISPIACGSTRWSTGIRDSPRTSMAGRPYILAETNWKAVRETKFDVAVLPWGATEAHNYHLPYGTDVIECDHVAAESARLAWEQGARVVVLPTVPFGVQTGQLEIPFCINMNPSTQRLVLRDVGQALAGQGVRRLVILNGHGGNDFKAMIRDLQPQVPDIFLC